MEGPKSWREGKMQRPKSKVRKPSKPKSKLSSKAKSQTS